VSAPPPSLKQQALRLLAQRDHSRAELERKLARRARGSAGPAEALELGAVLDHLEAAGLIAPERVAEAVVAAKSARLGRCRIEQILQARGIDRPTIETALASATAASEVERARRLWQRRFGAPPADAAARAKQVRFLAWRGFAADVIDTVIGARDSEA
jgi:regulatory protein